jgi:hypothetical protein
MALSLAISFPAMFAMIHTRKKQYGIENEVINVLQNLTL